jgi:carbamoyltransferase
MTAILGISAFYHDSAACLLVDGEIVAAAQEERFSRKKHDASFPLEATRWCLTEAGLGVEELSYVGFYDKPLLKFDRLLETYLDYAPSGFPSFLKAIPTWMTEKLWMETVIREQMGYVSGAISQRAAKKFGKRLSVPILFGDHHESHAASAFYPSPYEQAAVLTIDGVGEWATSSIGLGTGHRLEMLKELTFPHSLGLLYSAFTYFAGFKVNSGEYKLMGLAPYGEPKYVDLIAETLVDVREDGSLWMNQDYFGYASGLRMTNSAFSKLFGAKPRLPESPVTQFEMDLAASIQWFTEDVVLKMARHAHAVTGQKHLCMAGGVALNCVANGRVLREGPFDDIWIQPAAGDAGGAVGIAFAIWHRYLDQPRQSPERLGTWTGESEGVSRFADGMKGGFLGPANSEDEIESFLTSRGLPFHRYSREALPKAVAELIAAQKVVGLHQGRMEFGPRALGGRSILGDARSPNMQSVMNLKIKNRESFRPFAPAVLQEKVGEWFDFQGHSPYMLLVGRVAQSRISQEQPDDVGLFGIEKLLIARSEIPAVTHVDYSARIQTVCRETNPLYWEIIAAFDQLTGCPVVVNTSFNVRGEPIVCTPEDSYRCFMRTDMDALVLETFVLEKSAQPAFHETHDWRREFELD